MTAGHSRFGQSVTAQQIGRPSKYRAVLSVIAQFLAFSSKQGIWWRISGRSALRARICV